MTDSPPRRRDLPMATLLPLLFGGLAVLAVVPVATLGFLSARDTTGRLLRDSAHQEMGMLGRRVADHLEPVATQLRYLAEEVASGHLDPADAAAMDMAMRSAVAATPQVAAIGHIGRTVRCAVSSAAGATSSIWRRAKHRALRTCSRAHAAAARGAGPPPTGA